MIAPLRVYTLAGRQVLARSLSEAFALAFYTDR